MPKIIGTGINQVPTNAMLGGLAYQSPDNILIKGAEIENINAISAYINRTATSFPSSIFVYDTRKDSDGGAWRKRTSHTSWYNEPPGEYRGHRKEFPSIAVIVGTTAEVTIYDGDDPNLSMWMVFKAAGAGMSNQAVLQYVGSPYRACALNGQVVMGQYSGGDNWGNPAVNFISEEIIRADPHTSEGGLYAGGIAHRNQTTGTGFVTPGSGYVIRNSQIRDIAMRVLPDALNDPQTGLPWATIAYATAGGISIVTANEKDRPVYDIMTDSSNSANNLSMFIDITETGKLIFEQDGSNGQSIFMVDIPTADRTVDHTSYDITDKWIIKPVRGSNNTQAYPRWNEPIGTSQGCGYGIAMKDSAHALLSYGSASNGGKVTLFQPQEGWSASNDARKYGRVAYITRDYNTGWMYGGIKACWCSEAVQQPLSTHNYALDVTLGSTNRLTSHTYSSGALGWQMVDNASSNNGYVSLVMNGLTQGKKYKVTMTRSNHSPLDSGYNQMVQHKNGDALENSTKFTHWDINHGGSHSVSGIFVAQSTGDDDLVLYANACTINISNFSIMETNDIEYTGDSDLMNGFGAFDSASGWTSNSWTISGGKATSGSGNDSVYRTVGGFCKRQTYAIVVDVANYASNLYYMTGNIYNNRPISYSGTGQVGYIVSNSDSTMNLGFTNLGTTNQEVDNVKVRPVDADRASGEDRGIYAFSNSGDGITREPVEPGAELLGYYMGANVQDYLYQPYNSDLDFTDEMSVMFWVKDWTAQSSLMHRGPDTTRNSQTSFYLYCDAGYDYRFTLASTTLSGGNTVEQNFEIANSFNLTGWQFVCFSLRGGKVRSYLNGEYRSEGSFSGTNIYSQSGSKNGTYIGRGPVGTAGAFNGRLALFRLSSSGIKNDQDLKQIYMDERALFQPHAKCTVYGTSDDVNAISYDSTKDILHMGTSDGRSDFSGLVRINNTTQGITTGISASNGLIAEQ